MFNFVEKIPDILNFFIAKALTIFITMLSLFGLNNIDIAFLNTPKIEGSSNVQTIEEKVIKNTREPVDKIVENKFNTNNKKTLNTIVKKPNNIFAEKTIVNKVKRPILSLAPKVDQEKLNVDTRKALVNILCTTKVGGSFKPITGSGVIIDKKGVILTNAHVAQYLLLENYKMDGFINCLVRTGNPARATYRVKLLYISPSWVENNFKNITKSSPKGTGEDDYAFLLITEPTAQGSSLPVSFPAVKWGINQTEFIQGTPLLMAGYPAGFLGGITIQKDLWQVSSLAEVKKLFYFKFPYNIDLFSIGGNIIAQKGSSGGVAINLINGELVGLIVTSTLDGATSTRDMRAITLAHINRSLEKNKGEGLRALLNGNLSELSNTFYTKEASRLRGLLVGELNR